MNDNTGEYLKESADVGLIKSTYPDFFRNDLVDYPKIVFKSAHKFWIIVLEKTNQTRTNESRADVVFPNVASHRGSEFKVIKIFHKFEPTIVKNSIQNGTYDDSKNKVTYVVGQIVRPTIIKEPNGHTYGHFDEDLYKTHTHGIHYFNTIEGAFYYEVNKISSDAGSYTGKYYQFYPNGKLLMEIDYVDGLFHGRYIVYYTNGNKKFEYSYTHGEKNGMSRLYFADGKTGIETEYFRNTIVSHQINHLQRLRSSLSTTGRRFSFGMRGSGVLCSCF